MPPASQAVTPKLGASWRATHMRAEPGQLSESYLGQFRP